MATPAEAPSNNKGRKKAKAHQIEKKAEQAGKAEGKARIKYVNCMPRDEAVAYFEAVIAGLRKGAIEFRRGDSKVAISPAEQVDIEVKASRKHDRESVSFEISWRRGEDPELSILAG
jgi:amphi-Trp domain-containing protein